MIIKDGIKSSEETNDYKQKIHNIADLLCKKLKENKIDLEKYDVDKIVQKVKEKGIFD
ncbi:hypothetical protein Z962_p0005 (plasmid) [Clostridium botulinum C/D str. BKT12695]|nr:hypothetical protein Z962_p0005 [Clostridium botulinum C/D str. BKT12695]